MGLLTSKLFKDDPKLEPCLVSDPAHVTPGSRGPHVGKIQFALTVMGLGVINADEIAQQFYGQSTANAVLGYKRRKNIVNTSYQKTADNIVGKMTIKQLDKDMADFERLHPDPLPPGPGPLPGPPGPPQSPAQPTGLRFMFRAAGAPFSGGPGKPVFIEEPADNDPTTVSSESLPTCFEVFDVDNMTRFQLDGQHAAIYFFEAPGNLSIGISPNHYKRLPRLTRLKQPLPLDGLGGPCVYRTTFFPDGRRQSFFDLQLAQGTFSVPMFIHFVGGPIGTISEQGQFRFSHFGL